MNEVGDKPGQYSVSSTPSGSLWSNVAVYLREKGGLDFKLANYKGGGPSVRAVLAGETDFGCMGVTPMVNFIKAGQLRCLVAPGRPRTGRPPASRSPRSPTSSTTRCVQDSALDQHPRRRVKKGVPEEILAQIDDAFAAAHGRPRRRRSSDDNAFFPFQAPRQEANDLMGQRTALQAYIIEVVLGTAEKTRDELGIAKIEESAEQPEGGLSPRRPARFPGLDIDGPASAEPLAERRAQEGRQRLLRGPGDLPDQPLRADRIDTACRSSAMPARSARPA